MVPRRRLALGGLSLSVVALALFGWLALASGAASDDVGASSQGTGPTAHLAGGARPGVVDAQPSGGIVLWPWLGLLGSFVVMVGSGVILRLEIRKVKRAMRNRLLQRAVARDLRDFGRLGKGPGQNT